MTNDTTSTVKFWIEGVTNPIIGGLGILGNLTAIAVLLSKKIEIVQSIRHLLMVLATFDTLSIISYLIVTCPGNWSVYFRANYE